MDDGTVVMKSSKQILRAGSSAVGINAREIKDNGSGVNLGHYDITGYSSLVKLNLWKSYHGLLYFQFD